MNFVFFLLNFDEILLKNTEGKRENVLSEFFHEKFHRIGTGGGGAGWGLTKEVSMHAASGRGGGGPWVAGDAHRRLHRLGQAGVLLLELELLLSLLQRGMPSSRVHGASCACNIHGAWVARVWSMQRSMPAARERSGRRRRAPPVWPPRC